MLGEYSYLSDDVTPQDVLNKLCTLLVREYNGQTHFNICCSDFISKCLITYAYAYMPGHQMN